MMPKFRALSFLISSLVSSIFATACLTSCAKNSPIKEPPFGEPFDLSQVGKKFNFDVKIENSSTYALDVRFYNTRPDKYFRFSTTQPTPEELREFDKILGISKRIGPGQWLELGVPATFVAQIYTMPDKKILLAQVIKNPGTSATSFGRYAEILRIHLNPGRYSINIEYVQGDSELSSLPARISFDKAHHGK